MGDNGIYLTRTEQIEELLSKGCEIYEVSESGGHTLFASPRARKAITLPELEQVSILTLGGGTDG